MEIRIVGVLGAGQMGLGIAQAAARAGFETIVAKATPGALEAQRGKRKFADLHVPYDSKRQTHEVKVARTANADGVHDASPEEVSDIVPDDLRDATVYSSVRERVISFPAVDKGSVLDLVYTRTTQATDDAAQGGELLLADWDPVELRIVRPLLDRGLEGMQRAVEVGQCLIASSGQLVRPGDLQESYWIGRIPGKAAPCPLVQGPRALHLAIAQRQSVVLEQNDPRLEGHGRRLQPREQGLLFLQEGEQRRCDR